MSAQFFGSNRKSSDQVVSVINESSVMKSGCLLRIIDTSVFGYFSIKLSFKFLIDRLPIVTPS